MYEKRYQGNRHVLLAGVPVLCLLAACERGAPAADMAFAGSCHPQGQLQVDLHGAIQGSLDWAAGRLACEGMPRPDGRGARLRLAGPLGAGGNGQTNAQTDAQENAGSLAFIVAIPDLQAGATGREMPTKVTLIEESSGRFFSTQDTGACWTDISRQEPLRARRDEDSDAVFSISGVVYCIAPLAELTGGSSISFTELTFTGQLDWTQPE